MNVNRSLLVLVAAGSLLLPACRTKPDSVLADAGKRKDFIEALVSNPASRQEVIDRLLGPPNDRSAVFDRILKDEAAAGDLIAKVLAADRGKAIIASKVAADNGGAKTFIRMLMLTGVMGESMTQKQADAFGLGDAFSFGNQRRTMIDLRKVGALIEEFAKQRHGQYPVCDDFGAVESCLGRKMPSGVFEGLRTRDAWGRSFQYHSDREGKEYILVSYATDGLYDELGKVGPTNSFDCDIVFSNGDFIQWPGYMRKNDIR
jgi:hypothetical protein